MACNTNEIYFKHVLRGLRQHHEDPDLSKCTLVDICGTDNPSIINNIPRETFLARVDAMKRDLGLPVMPSEAKRVADSRARYAARVEASAKREAEVAERRRAARAEARAKREAELAERRAVEDAARAAEVERIQALERPRKKQEQAFIDVVKKTQKERAEREANGGKAPTYKLNVDCAVAFPKKSWKRNLFVHLSGHHPGKAGQQPTPVKTSSKYCRSKEACEDCQKWVRKLAEENVSVGVPGAGWAHSRDAVLEVAAEVRAAFPSITFDGVDLHVAGPSKRKPTAPPARSGKRVRTAPKKMGA